MECRRGELNYGEAEHDRPRYGRKCLWRCMFCRGQTRWTRGARPNLASPAEAGNVLWPNIESPSTGTSAGFSDGHLFCGRAPNTLRQPSPTGTPKQVDAAAARVVDTWAWCRRTPPDCRWRARSVNTRGASCDRMPAVNLRMPEGMGPCRPVHQVAYHRWSSAHGGTSALRGWCGWRPTATSSRTNCRRGRHISLASPTLRGTDAARL